MFLLLIKPHIEVYGQFVLAYDPLFVNHILHGLLLNFYNSILSELTMFPLLFFIHCNTSPRSWIFLIWFITSPGRKLFPVGVEKFSNYRPPCHLGGI